MGSVAGENGSLGKHLPRITSAQSGPHTEGSKVKNMQITSLLDWKPQDHLNAKQSHSSVPGKFSCGLKLSK